jgi:hypothetical protein
MIALVWYRVNGIVISTAFTRLLAVEQEFYRLLAVAQV